MTNKLRFLAVVGLLTVGWATLSAQSVLNSTTLAAAVADGLATAVSLTATTGVTNQGTGSGEVFLLVDKELMQVRTVDTTAKIAQVIRGANSTRAVPHVNGATVWVVPPPALVGSIPSGQCTRSSLLYVPVVVGGNVGLGSDTGSLFDCLGVT